MTRPTARREPQLISRQIPLEALRTFGWNFKAKHSGTNMVNKQVGAFLCTLRFAWGRWPTKNGLGEKTPLKLVGHTGAKAFPPVTRGNKGGPHPRLGKTSDPPARS